MPPTVAHAAASGDTINSPPNAVATAFPPRKRANTGHECPMHAASPAAACAAGSAPDRRAMATAPAPLATSRAKVIAPALAPTVRSTLAVPMLPLPKSRTSRPPTALPTISPKGTDPIRYPAAQLVDRSRVASHAATSLAPHHIRRQHRHPGRGPELEGRPAGRAGHRTPAGIGAGAGHERHDGTAEPGADHSGS